VIAVVAGVLGAGAGASALPPAATATLVKGMPIVIRTEGHGGLAPSFTPTSRPRGSDPVRDRGSAVQMIATARVERLSGGVARREVEGTDLLESPRGTLTPQAAREAEIAFERVVEAELLPNTRPTPEPSRSETARTANEVGRCRATAGAFVCALVPLAAAEAAPSTLVRGDRVSIESRGDGHAGRTFTLTYRSRVDRSADLGSSFRVVKRRSVDVLSRGVRRRHVSGIEVLEGGRGTLSLSWSVEQVQSNGRWGGISGRWFVIEAGGVYHGRSGQGELSADPRFRTTTYRGLLVTSW
jgi:hypothetical protein